MFTAWEGHKSLKGIPVENRESQWPLYLPSTCRTPSNANKILSSTSFTYVPKLEKRGTTASGVKNIRDGHNTYCNTIENR